MTKTTKITKKNHSKVDPLRILRFMQVVYEFSLSFLVSFVFFVLNVFCGDPSRESDRPRVLLRHRGADKRSNRIEMPRVTLEPPCLAEVGWLKVVAQRAGASRRRARVWMG
jgi:hypothetical protein